MKTCPTCGQNMPQDKLELAGEAAIRIALEYWGRDIYDPKLSDTTAEGAASKNAISAMIQNGLGWTWEPRYKGDGSFEWCGAFAAYCWATSVKPSLRKTYFASTYRLDRFGRYGSVNGEKNEGKGRLICDLNENSGLNDLTFEPRAGDILLIGPAGSGYGKHICLVESFSPNLRTFHTLEGNGTGTGPHGERQQGVVKGVRVLGGQGWHARRLIRPSIEDLI